MKKHIFLALVICSSLIYAQEKNLADISPKSLMKYIKKLSANKMKGRRAGTKYERRAAKYIAKTLKKKGVAPLPESGRYQKFAFAKYGKSLRSSNVFGWIPGNDPKLKKEIVVIGSHYDHLGAKGRFVYNGADDNASGAGIVLEIADVLQQNRHTCKRSILIIFFGAEEMGLIGSFAFVRRPQDRQEIDLKNVVVMINIDMIGRRLIDQPKFFLPKKLGKIDDTSSVGVFGTKEFPLLRKIVKQSCSKLDLQVVAPEDFPMITAWIENMAQGRSDHAPFEKEGIPTVFFCSGESSDYHRPTDTFDKLDQDLIVRRAKAIYDVVVTLANVPSQDITALRKKKNQNKLPKIEDIDPEAIAKSKELVEKSRDLMRETKLDQALMTLEQSIKLNPYMIAAYIDRGDIYQAYKDYGKAIKEYNRVLEINDRHPIAYFRKGYAYLGLKNWDRSIQQFTLAIMSDPTYSEAYVGRAIAYKGRGKKNQDSGDFEKSIRDYEKAEELKRR